MVDVPFLLHQKHHCIEESLRVQLLADSVVWPEDKYILEIMKSKVCTDIS